MPGWTFGNWSNLNVGQLFGHWVGGGVYATTSRQPCEPEVANTRHIVERMLCFALDVALIEGECHHPELITESWGGDSLEIFCAPDHPLAKQGQLSPRDFARETWIVRETGSGTREAFRSSACRPSITHCHPP